MNPSAASEAQQNPIARPSYAKIAAISGAALVFFLLFVAFILFCSFGLLRNSDPVRLALAKARTNASVLEQIGQPIHEGWLVKGKLHTTDTSGHAELSIPIDGPKGKGAIDLVADKNLSTWSFSKLQVAPENGTARINLLESGPVPATPSHAP
jgi:hypothetical protein